VTDEKTSGQIAFESYNISKGGLTYDGKPIPPWSSLTDETGQAVKEAWENAAMAVENALMVKWDHEPRIYMERAHRSIEAFVPNGRQRSLVMTKLEEALLWFGVTPKDDGVPR
jgi:hypothetical protein